MQYSEIMMEIKNSPFNKHFYEVNIMLSSGVSGLFMYTGVAGEYYGSGGREVPVDKVFQAVPVFQRDNNQWTVAMQQSFIKNVISGFRTHIALFQIGNKNMASCQILDGLQRITAITEFVKGNFKVFGHTYTELKELGVLKAMRGGTIAVRVYSFKNLNEAIDFYVSMNENITHSPEDIQKAINFKE